MCALCTGWVAIGCRELSEDEKRSLLAAKMRPGYPGDRHHNTKLIMSSFLEQENTFEGSIQAVRGVYGRIVEYLLVALTMGLVSCHLSCVVCQSPCGGCMLSKSRVSRAWLR